METYLIEEKIKQLRQSYIGKESVPTEFTAWGRSGKLTIYGEPPSPEYKEIYFKALTGIFIVETVTRYLAVFEAWVAEQRIDKLPMQIPVPSQHPKREENVIIILVDGDETKVARLIIKRDHEGKIIKLARREQYADDFMGRMCDLNKIRKDRTKMTPDVRRQFQLLLDVLKIEVFLNDNTLWSLPDE